MRTPDELDGDEAATVRELWAIWPHGLLVPPEGDHTTVKPLVRDGYVQTIDREELGTEYRLDPGWGERLDRVMAGLRAQASQN